VRPDLEPPGPGRSPVGRFKKILPLKLPGQDPVTAPLELLLRTSDHGNVGSLDDLTLIVVLISTL
jgi:hypothetical protein